MGKNDLKVTPLQATPYGVRIKPQADRVVPDNGMVVLTDRNRPRPQPKYGEKLEDVQPYCSKCGIQHFYKTLHLQLRAGSVIVSHAVWEYMKTMVDDGGFEFVNVVDEPPAQTMVPGQETRLLEKYVMDLTPSIKAIQEEKK